MSSNKIAINIPTAFVLPRGAILPENAALRAVTVTNIKETCSALANHTDSVPVALIFENMDLLSVLIKHQDLVPWIPSAMVGVPGGEYDILFDQVVFGVDKVSFDVLNDELKGKREKPVDRKARDIADSIDESTLLKRRGEKTDQFGPDSEDSD